MARLWRAVPYGAGIWVCLVVVSLVLLPLEDANEALHESLKSAALAAIVLAFTVRRLGRPDPSAPPGMLDGLAVGLVWAAVAVLCRCLQVPPLPRRWAFNYHRWCARPAAVMAVVRGDQQA